VASDGSTSFQVYSIVDPENTDPDACTKPTYKPRQLAIRVRGLGPNSSEKNMEVVVDRYTLDYPVKAVVTIPNGSGAALPFNLGGSNVTSTSGIDIDGGDSLAAYAINNADYNTVNNVIDGCNADGTNCGGSGPNVFPGDPAVLTSSNTPS